MSNTVTTQKFIVPTAEPLFYRTYSRVKDDNTRESFNDVVIRCQNGTSKLGNFTTYEAQLTEKYLRELKVFPSGRWLWVGGTAWIDKPENVYGGYNCSTTVIDSLLDFGRIMNLLMQGSGAGFLVESANVSKLPKIINKVNLMTEGTFGSKDSIEDSYLDGNILIVGDSRKGWVDSVNIIMDLFTNPNFASINLTIDISHVRKSESLIKGFGGRANPIDLVKFYGDITNYLNDKTNSNLTPSDCTWLICRIALTVVAGNIRRSATIGQGDMNDVEFANLKSEMWTVGEDGSWSVNPKKDALRMANLTRVMHTKPTYQEVLESLKIQFTTSEGALMFAPEAVARSNADLLTNQNIKSQFINLYCESKDLAKGFLSGLFYNLYKTEITEDELINRMMRYCFNPCAEELQVNNLCNLAEVHLNNIDPWDYKEQTECFTAASLQVCSLLNQKFDDPKYQDSRDLDPRVQVSFTGLFDFMVKALGIGWLQWWEQGREINFSPVQESDRETIESLGFTFGYYENKDVSEFYTDYEQSCFTKWKTTVQSVVKEYCERNNLRVPNRVTGVQPAGSKSLLTGASCGWHPPKAQRFIRRITFQAYHPVAMACIDMGYSVVPSQSCKDDNGNLLNDAYDPRVNEWLIEIPVSVDWASIPGVENIEIEKFSALAQFNFYMQVQKYYTTINTSATIEYNESEIEPLSKAIYEAIRDDEGYVSVALQSRFDAPFPRLPFEKIDESRYNIEISAMHDRRTSEDFYQSLMKHDKGWSQTEGASGCDSDKCLLPLTAPSKNTKGDIFKKI